ncbi:MAG: hypothetical protein IKU47_00010 [Oscillospiraceae bacterium]|nr:hypothetical protein [Oscillospiraceae bacterium]
MPRHIYVGETAVLISRLMDEVMPWVIGHEEIDGKNKPILKENAPHDIVKKRDKLFALIINEVHSE